MRRVTLEKVIDYKGAHLIAAKKVPPFNKGDIIELITPDDTYHVIFSDSGNPAVCDGCLFEATRLECGIRSCPAFKDDSLLCIHTKALDTRFIPLDRVLEDL